MDERIAFLCRLHGISRDYHDAWGHRREVPLETCRRLLAALGACPEDPATGASPPATHARGWLEPVYVLSCSNPAPQIPLGAGAPPGQTLAWRYTGAQGITREGTLSTGSPRDDGSIVWPLPFSVEPGSHELAFTAEDGTTVSTRLIGTPDCGYRPAKVRHDRRAFGISAQLYALRSERNWGVGDFTDLSDLIDYAAAIGASLIGINPLHVPFLQDPERASPYSPSSRLFLNPLYVDVEAVPEFEHSETARTHVSDPGFQAQIRALRGAPLVNYRAVWNHKKAVLEMLHRQFRRTAPETQRQAFSAFRARHGEALVRYSVYEALQEHFHERDPSVWGWPAWPEDYRHPQSSAVAQFTQTHEARVEFFAYLQWRTEEQLEAVGAKARARLGIGLYRDLAVGVDRGGAEVWADQDLFVLGASIGCPPDDLNQNGQDWGLPPARPAGLLARGFEPYLAAWRANMRCAGALRIDHVMGLLRLFWLPRDGAGHSGAYVHYPMEPLFRLLAYESQRQRCLVIGEDLGTVPPPVRQALADFGFLSYRVLYFEHDAEGVFTPPHAYPRDALVTVTTHDLPTLSGFWLGRDLDERRALGMFPSPSLADRQAHERVRDKQRLIEALVREGLWPAKEGVPEQPTAALMLAVHAYIARSPACLVLVQLEDLFMTSESVNLPGTGSERSNWRRKLPGPTETLDSSLSNRLSRIMSDCGRTVGRSDAADAPA
ncbi:MAG: 4-alpha-glucanotransferase [Acidiferrobacteraceae bacterium]